MSFGSSASAPASPLGLTLGSSSHCWSYALFLRVRPCLVLQIQSLVSHPAPLASKANNVPGSSRSGLLSYSFPISEGLECIFSVLTGTPNHYILPQLPVTNPTVVSPDTILYIFSKALPHIILPSACAILPGACATCILVLPGLTAAQSMDGKGAFRCMA